MNLSLKRKEFSIKINGEKHVVIARGNNDGEPCAYVYVLSEKDNKQVKQGSQWIYPHVLLDDAEDEHCFGTMWPFEETMYCYLSKQEKQQYKQLCNDAWTRALEDAVKQVKFLQNRSLVYKDEIGDNLFIATRSSR